ncbi:hypothetical protein ABBQ32_001178 [Trebouxia sp. C0010 RCD-2024]
MLSSLYASMQTAASVTAKLSLQSATGSRPSFAHFHRVARLNHAVKARPIVRHITAMSYSQAYPEPAAVPRSNRVYTNYAVYKGSAALNFKVIKPSWEYRADGALALKDAGVALLEFAPAQQGSGTAPGERRYDWENKSNIALSSAELGDLIDIISGGPGKMIYHDPNKGRAGEGTEGKSLGINPGNKNVKEVYLNLSHKVRGQPDKKVAVSLSAGEMRVIKRLSEYIIPYLLGFDELFQEGGNEQPEAFGTDWSRPPSNEPPVPMPTSAPF